MSHSEDKLSTSSKLYIEVYTMYYKPMVAGKTPRSREGVVVK